MISAILFFVILFFVLQTFILFCCLAAGNDPVSQAISDEEQLEFLAEWKKQHAKK